MTACSFFPFTHITADQKKTLGAFFRDVQVLDIGGTGLAGQETLEGKTSRNFGLKTFPLPQDRVQALDRQFADYMAWARLHRGNEKNLRHLIKDTPYFRADTDLASIRSQIMSPRDEGGNSGAADPGLFLKLAQNLDQETEAIDTRLRDLDVGRDSLLTELKGEKGGARDPRKEGGSGMSDPGRIMPAERMAAWTVLAQQAGMFMDLPQLLVTTSPEIFVWLEENAGGVINGLDIDSIKVHENECRNKDRWLQDVDNLLDKMLAGTRPPGREQGDALKQNSECCHLSGYLKIRLFSGEILNRIPQIPGGHLTVCLVGLNS